MIGDTAGLIHPCAVNGMAMAIHMQKICIRLGDPLSKWKIRELLEKKVAINGTIILKKRLKIGRLSEYYKENSN
jgi:hypothetical protein